MNFAKNTMLAVAAMALAAMGASAQTRLAGGDISMLSEMERAGSQYYTHEGTQVSDAMTLFHDKGLNAMRVRLFVDPSQYTGSDKANVCQDLEMVKTLGKRIKDAGMQFMLDFHYSDGWADPGQQWTPKSWQGLDDAALGTQLHDYTVQVLNELVEAGATPDLIQTGNEISYGMLWGAQTSTITDTDLGVCWPSSPTANWDRFAELLRQATSACREVLPASQVIVHVERVSNSTTLQGDNANYGALTNFFDKMAAYEIDYDVIGLSYYPYFHGALSAFEGAVSKVEAYGKPIMLVETGYPLKWAVNGTAYDYTWKYPYSDEGQAQFTTDLLDMLKQHESVTGVFWWWMEYNAYGTSLSGWYNAPLFDSQTGRATSALDVLGTFAATSGVTAPAADAAADNRWYDLQGRSLEQEPARGGIYIHQGKKVIKK